MLTGTVTQAGRESARRARPVTALQLDHLHRVRARHVQRQLYDQLSSLSRFDRQQPICAAVVHKRAHCFRRRKITSAAGTNCTAGRLWDNTGSARSAQRAGSARPTTRTRAQSACAEKRATQTTHMRVLRQGHGCQREPNVRQGNPGQFGRPCREPLLMRCPGAVSASGGQPSCVACPWPIPAVGKRRHAVPCRTYQDKAGMRVHLPQWHENRGKQSTSAENCSVSCSSCVVMSRTRNPLPARRPRRTRTQQLHADVQNRRRYSEQCCQVPFQLEQVDECGAPLAVARRRLEEGLVLSADNANRGERGIYCVQNSATGGKGHARRKHLIPCLRVQHVGTYNDCSASCYPSAAPLTDTIPRTDTASFARRRGLLWDAHRERKCKRCPVQCVQYWGNWGSCSATCGANSVQSRLRVISRCPRMEPPVQKPFSEIGPSQPSTQSARWIACSPKRLQTSARSPAAEGSSTCITQ